MFLRVFQLCSYSCYSRNTSLRVSLQQVSSKWGERMRENCSLNGSWNFLIDLEDQGERDSWFVKGLIDARQAEVPHIWQREEEYVHYCGTGWYEKQFTQ